jgi:hypothetical protein
MGFALLERQNKSVFFWFVIRHKNSKKNIALCSLKCKHGISVVCTERVYKTSTPGTHLNAAAVLRRVLHLLPLEDFDCLREKQTSTLHGSPFERFPHLLVFNFSQNVFLKGGCGLIASWNCFKTAIVWSGTEYVLSNHRNLSSYIPDSGRDIF